VLPTRGSSNLIKDVGSYFIVLITHCLVRIKFSEVCPIVPSPSMQLHPNHHADDIGARLGVPSWLRVEISATGVPKYKIVGSTVRCLGRPYRTVRVCIYPLLAPEFKRQAFEVSVADC